MLTVDLVRAYRRGGELKLTEMKTADRERAVGLATQYVSIVKAHVGHTRGALDEALSSVTFGARDRKVAGGLRKLLVDRCVFEATSEHNPARLRRALFERAAAARRSAEMGTIFDRQRVVTEAAIETGVDSNDVDRLMYSDLKSAHIVLAFTSVTPEILVDLYAEGQAQAVLLRARRVVARVYDATPDEYRLLFHKLKFLRLLYTIEAMDGGGYEIVVDGPYSLFRSVTKYGLSLALMLPALSVCRRFELQADVEWGKKRDVLTFKLDSQNAKRRASDDEPAELPEETARLLERFQHLTDRGKSEWDAMAAADILSLPGVGLCVPDLMFVHRETGECVYLEVMGFWSRDAVWRRVELVERGLPHRIIFAVSSRLRVSEAALDVDSPGALYVYKGTISASAIAQRLQRLIADS